ncbi:MAG: helix-turn-helix transcriptional regulator [Pirellula sp.]
MGRRGVFVNGPRLVELYRRRGWSQLDLAGKSGLDVRTIAKVKKGGACDASTLQRLASALNVSPEALMLTEAQQAKPSQSVFVTNDSIEPHVEQTDLKLIQVWRTIDLRAPYVHGEVPSGVVLEHYRFLKQSDARPSIVFPYLTWGEEIRCLSHPAETTWQRVPVLPGDIVPSDKQWELTSIAPEGPAGTQFELAPIHLLYVNSFHADGFQWWQTRIAFEIESLIIQVLFADNLRCKRIQGGVAWPGQRNFVGLPNNDPDLLPDGSIANWHIRQPCVGAFYRVAWNW